MKTPHIYTLSLLILLLSACSTDKIPGVYRIDIQQGNEITQDMINQLKPGMTKNQVAYVMGTPLIIDTFHPNRWDYLYTFHLGNGDRQQRRITVFFSNNRISHLEGHMTLVARSELPETTKVDSDVVVPLNNKKVGLIEDLKESMGMGDDDEVADEMEEKVDLFKDRPIPQPTQSEGLLDRLSISGSEAAETIEEEIVETVPSEAVESENADSPGLFQRLKNGVGLGD